MGWTLFYMLVVLKIPVIAAFVLIWYAVREPDDQQGDSDDDGPGPDHDPTPRAPRTPRRGPHPERPPRSPERVRVTARRLEPVPSRHP